MKEPATLYLLVGLPGAGKTTRAKQLEIEASALRFTPDEWMIPLFERDDPAARDVLEGRLIWTALCALKLHTNVILDFGFWGKDDRSSLRWMARQIGAKSQVIYLPIDIEAQQERVQNRFVEKPDQTWQISEAELTTWRTLFDASYDQPTCVQDTPIVANGVVYVGATDDQDPDCYCTAAYSMSAATGAQLGYIEDDNGESISGESPIVVVNGVLYYAAADGVYAYHAA